MALVLPPTSYTTVCKSHSLSEWVSLYKTGIEMHAQTQSYCQNQMRHQLNTKPINISCSGGNSVLPKGYLEMSTNIWLSPCHLWVEARNAAKHPTMWRTAPQQRICWPKTFMEPRLRNPEIHQEPQKLTILKKWDWRRSAYAAPTPLAVSTQYLSLSTFIHIYWYPQARAQ